MTGPDTTEWHRGGHRLHPLSPLFEIGRSFFRLVLPGLVVLFLATEDKSDAWYMLAFVPAVFIAVIRYLTFRYQLTSDHVVVREGLFFRKIRHIPYARIQNIDTVQNPLHRLFGVIEARLETASGKEPEAVFRVLSAPSVEEIREGVFGERGVRPAGVPSGAVAAAPAAPDFFRMSPLDVAYFGLLSQKGLALLGGLLFVIWEFDLWERFRNWLNVDPTTFAWLLSAWILVPVVLVLLVVLQGLTVVWAFVTLYDFHIVRSKDDLRTTCGLWTRQSATLPRYRIQFLSVREGFLHRRMRRISVKILTAGGDSTSDSQVSRKWLVPLVEREALEPILREVQPEVSFAGTDWLPVHPRAWRRMFVRWSVVFLALTAVFAFRIGWWALPMGAIGVVIALLLARARARRLGYTVTDKAVLMRDGVWTRVQNAVLFSKIQSVSLSQTPFDRRHRMATLRVDTAGASDAELSFTVPYLPLRTAHRLMDRLVNETSPLAFQW